MSNVNEYKCPNCGGTVQFDSGTQNMKCEFCDSEFSVEAMEAESVANQNMSDSEIKWNDLNSDWGDENKGMKVYLCNSCGGEIVCDETTSATKCPYCDSQVTMKGAFEGDYRPDIIIPFQLDKKSAKEKYLSFIGNRFFLPKDFKDKNHIDEIKGLYVPEWLFDCDVSASVMYDATKVRTWSDSNYIYTKTSHFNVYRSGDMSFAAIPVDGSSKMPDELMESIEPFDVSKAVDFKTAYLAGYLSDKYDVGVEESLPRANERIRNSAADALRKTVTAGYSSITTKNSGVNTNRGINRYALYPVWILNTTYKGKKHVFIMNGQTGKMAGDMPINKGKFFGVGLGVTAAITTVLYIISHFFFGL